ncbi:death-associated protein kinase 2-like isoform X2 [Oscarella lobularis]
MRKRKGRMGVPIGDIKREMDIMNKLTHGRHLMGLHDAFETQTEIVLILDLLSGGELFDHLATMDCLTEGETVAFTVQVLEALRIMHSSQIVHLDLKPENLMLKDKHKKELVLIDFGLARELDGSGLRLMLGTAEFIAPEVVSFDEITTATDMWSLGVLIYIMLSGYSPFLGDDQADTYANISAGEYDLDDEYFGDVSDEAKDFISKLLILNPKKRMTLDECLSHPWLNPTPKTEVRRLDSKRLKAFNARRKLKAGINAVRGSVKFRLSLERISIGKRQCSLTSSSPSPPVKEEDDVFKTE